MSGHTYCAKFSFWFELVRSSKGTGKLRIYHQTLYLYLFCSSEIVVLIGAAASVLEEASIIDDASLELGSGTNGAVCVAVAEPLVEVVAVNELPSAVANPWMIRWNRAKAATG